MEEYISSSHPDILGKLSSERDSQLSPASMRKVQALVQHLSEAINTYAKSSTSNQHKKHAANFLKNLIPEDSKKVDANNAYYLLYSLQEILEHFEKEWTQKSTGSASPNDSPRNSPIMANIMKGVKDLKDNKLSINKVGEFLPLVINALFTAKAKETAVIDKKNISVALPFLKEGKAIIRAFLTQLPPPSPIQMTSLAAANSLIKYTLEKGTQRHTHLAKSDIAITIAKQLMQPDCFQTWDNVKKLLAKFNEGIGISRAEGESERSLDLENILIQTRDYIIDHIFLEEQSGFDLNTVEINTTNQKIAIFQEIFKLVCLPGKVSARAPAILAAIQQEEPEETKQQTDITDEIEKVDELSLSYVRNIFSPEMLANKRKFNFGEYISHHAKQLAHIISSLLDNMSADTNAMSELYTYAYLLNSMVITHSSSETASKEKMVDPSLFENDISPIARSPIYIKLSASLEVAKQAPLSLVDINRIKESYRTDTVTSPRVSGRKSEKAKFKQKAYFIVSGIGARVENSYKGQNNWDYFPGLGVALAIGTVPIGTLREPQAIIDKCNQVWKTQLSLVSSALNDHEHKRFILKPARLSTWTKRQVAFIHLPLPDNLKNIPRDSFKAIANLAQTVAKMWRADLKDELEDKLFTAWNDNNLDEGKQIFEQMQKPKLYLSHCKAGKTRSVSLALCCLAALYVELQLKAKAALSNDSLTRFLNNTVKYMKTQRPQVDMYDSLISDVVSFAEYYAQSLQPAVALSKEEINEDPQPFQDATYSQ